MKTIKGIWNFNDTIEIPEWQNSDCIINFNVAMGNSYLGFAWGPNILEYLMEEENFPVHNGEEWLVEKSYRLLDFGNIEQEIDDEFYSWFTANAKQEKIYGINSSLLIDIANTIRENTNTETSYTPQAMPEAIKQACETNFQNGKENEKTEFWENFQDEGNRTNYDYGFGGRGWTDQTFDPPYPIIYKGTGKDGSYVGAVFYRAAKLTEINQIVMLMDGPEIRDVFVGCTALKTIKDLRFKGIKVYTRIFASCPNIEDIAFGNTATTVNGVTVEASDKIINDISFYGQAKLTDTSLINIVNQLADDNKEEKTIEFNTALQPRFNVVTIEGKTLSTVLSEKKWKVIFKG